jgi:hypothetical protein
VLEPSTPVAALRDEAQQVGGRTLQPTGHRETVRQAGIRGGGGRQWVLDHHQLVAERGRLLGRVEACRDVVRAFAADCSARLRARVEAVLAAGGVPAATAAQLRGYVDDAQAAAGGGNAAVVAYVAARASAALAGGPAGFVAERRRQAAWLDQRLGLASAPRG